MKILPHNIALSAVILFTACTNSEAPKDTLSELKTSVEYLASDELEGREIGTNGEKLAAEYISQKLKSYGVGPAGTDGFYQYFDVTPSMNPHEKPKVGEGGDSLSIQGRNVIGKIDNPSDEIIVIGAHYDHLGYGGFGSLHRGEAAIHNGADDNASGVSIILESARILKQIGLQKDVVFIGFTGEEKGLWGSNYYTKNPTIDLSKVTAMINLDMVGRLDESRGLAVHGVGTSPKWNEVISTNNTDSLKLTIRESGVGPSDHTSFYLQDIPVLHLFTGQHEDYHKPEDDADKLNYEGMEKVLNFIIRICQSLDEQPKLAFTKTQDESSDTPRFKVTLGVVPDYLFDGNGMRIDGVSEGKVAQKAGLKKGDIVVQLGDSSVTDMMSYMRALSAFESGMQTVVTVRRADETLTFDIEFQ